jgi:hypothetical protein
MPNAELIRQHLAKIEPMIDCQVHLIKQLGAEGADTTEAEQLLACWSAAYTFFARRLEAALVRTAL